MSDVELSKRMPLDELQQTQEYRNLTPKQQLWVSTFVQNGVEHGDYNPVMATLVAFRCKNSSTARVYSYAILKNIRIVEVLNLHYRTDPIDAFLKQIERAVYNKKITLAQVQALRLKCELLGIGTRLPVYTSDDHGTSLRGVKRVADVPLVSENPVRRKAGRPPKNPEKPKKTSPSFNTSDYE